MAMVTALRQRSILPPNILLAPLQGPTASDKVKAKHLTVPVPSPRPSCKFITKETSIWIEDLVGDVMCTDLRSTPSLGHSRPQCYIPS